MRRIHYPFPVGAESLVSTDAHARELGWPVTGTYNPSSPGSTFDTWNANSGIGASAISSSVVVIKTGVAVVEALANGSNFAVEAWTPTPGMSFLMLPPVLQIDSILIVSQGPNIGTAPWNASTTTLLVAAGKPVSPTPAPGSFLPKFDLSASVLAAQIPGTDLGWSNAGGDALWQSAGTSGNQPSHFVGASGVAGAGAGFGVSINATSQLGLQVQFLGVPGIYQFPFLDSLPPAVPATKMVVSISNNVSPVTKMYLTALVYIPIIPLN